MKRVAVTGAAGFLGSHITHRLAEEGYLVRALVHGAESKCRIDDKAESIIVADIGDAAALDMLAKDADAFIHLVSNFRTASGPPSSYKEINVEGTRNALRAARKAGVKRFVHCSTIGVHGHVRSTPATEDSDFNPGDLYQTTKAEAEQLVRADAKNPGMEIVIIRPCSIYGPGDMRMLKMFRMLSKGTFFKVGPCDQNFHAVYIDDLVGGFLRALTVPGIHGETFILGGPSFVTLEDYIDLAAHAVGAPPPRIRLPYWLLYSLGVVCEGLCVPFGIEPPLHRRRVRFYRNNRAFSIDKAQRMLNYRPEVDLKDGMQRTVTWYRANGYLPRSKAD